MKHFEPLSTYLSPCLTAVVRIPETSEPASGSVRQKETSFSSSVTAPRYFFLTSSEPPKDDRRGRQAVAAERGLDPGAAPRELLLDQAPVEVAEAGAAVLLGDVGVHQPHLPRLLEDLLGPRAVLVVLPGDRADLLLGEVVRQLAQVLLLVCEREIDHVCQWAPRAGAETGRPGWAEPLAAREID